MAIAKRTRFIMAITLQIAVIFTMIAYKVSILRGGAEVLLKIEPLDPRDMLRGDYITFQYAISNLDQGLLQGTPVRNGDTVYVTLLESGKFWTAYTVHSTKPQGDALLFLKGKVASGGLASGASPADSHLARGSRIHVVYGIEEYFIPEGKGRGINLRGIMNESFARVAIDRNGKAVLRQIHLDGKPWP